MGDGDRRPLTPIEVVGRLSEAADEAGAAAEAIGEKIENLTTELADERLWRRRARRGQRLLLAVLVGVAVYVGWQNHQTNRVLDQLQAVQVCQNASTSSASCENHQILEALPNLINSTDCRVRSDLGVALHAVAPRSHFIFPATAYCPAITY